MSQDQWRSDYSKALSRVVPNRVLGAEETLGSLLRNAPMPNQELTENIALFNSPRILKRLLFLDEIYRQILPVHGVVMQFGVRWGRDIAVLDSLRTIYEPFNISRTVIGFDTFEGFPSIHERDGTHSVIRPGAFDTSENYVAFLQQIIECRQAIDPLPNLKRCEIVKGDAGPELERWLDGHPEAIIAMAHFDMDIYEPTKRCLELIMERCTKGSLIAFDELNLQSCPGETLALREVIGLGRYAIRRSPSHSGQGSFIVLD